MARFESILVASDLSTRADRAFRRAVDLSRQHGARLHALHVIERMTGADAPPAVLLKRTFGTADAAIESLARQAEFALRKKLAALVAPPDLGEVTVSAGTPFVEITRLARERDVDLVVIGAHGAHYLKDWLIGTTAERVVRHSDRPVLVVKQPLRDPYRRILAAVDFSDTAGSALGLVRRLAPKAKVSLLHVYDLSQMEAPAIDLMSSREFMKLQAEYEREQRTRLSQLAGDLGLGTGKSVNLVRYGYPGRVINSVVDESRADLVAVGTRGLSGVRHLLLGSVAEHVLRESRCDVLVVSPAAASAGRGVS